MTNQLIIHIDQPYPGWWSATPDGFDGTRSEDPKHDDNRIGTGRTKWDALRELIDAMEDDESRRKVSEAKAKIAAGTYDSNPVINGTVDRIISDEENRAMDALNQTCIES